MKDKKIILALFLAASIMLALFTGCDDAGVETKTPTGGPMPNIQMKPGSYFYYNNDSIAQNGTVYNTAWRTKDSIRTQENFGGKDCFPIQSITQDTTIPNFPVTIQSQTLYVSYDSQTGVLYQWGVKKLFDPAQTETWDSVADFSRPLGTPVPLFTINGIGGQTFLSANVSSTVQYDTTIIALASGVSVNCYKIAVVADFIVSGLSVGKAYIDYYIGYTPSSSTNPSGRIKLKFYPVNIMGFTYPGGDQKLNRFFVP
jgi:hypothetical protein